MAGGDQGGIELEHAIGYSAEFLSSIIIHPNLRNYFYITGACVIIGEINNLQGQSFLRGHDDTVTCVALSPSGALLASGQRGYNADVLVWDLSTQAIKFRFSEHDNEIKCMDFSHDSRLLCTCGNATDGKMFIWDCATGYIVASVGLAPSPTLCVKFGGWRKDVKGRPIDKYQIATAGDKRIVVWSLDPFTGELENEALNTNSAIREFQTLDFTPGGERFLFAGTTSGDFFVFMMKNHHLFCTQIACSKGIVSLVALNEENVLVGGGDGSLSQWQVQGNRSFEISRINLTGGISGLSPAPDRSIVLAGTTLGFQYQIRTSDLASGMISENHTRPVTYVNFPAGVSDKFATSSEDGTIRIWDGSDYRAISRCVASAAGAPLCFFLTLEILVSGWEDGKIRSFRADNGQQLWQIDNAHRGGVTSIAIAHNQRFFCTGGSEGEVRVWEIRTREMVSHLKEHTTRVTDINLLTDDVHLVSVSRDRCMLTWDLRNDKRITAQTQRTGGINALSVTSDQNVVITAGQERKINKWDLRQTQPIVSQDAGPGQGTDEIYALAVSHDGRFVATGGEKMVIRIWDISSMRVMAEGYGHSGSITRIAWAFDNKQVVSTGKDNCTLIWNIFL